MKKFDKEQDFIFKISIKANVKNDDYDEAMRNIIDEINNINKGNIIIEKIEWSQPAILSI